MTAFVITAAGRGTRIGRVGEKLHKSLVPLNGQAVLSHIIGLAPINARIIICVGHMADQIRDYIELAHPQLDVTFVDVPNWDQPDGGPGASLLAARDAVGDDDMVFTSCDTLWERDQRLWREQGSWIGIAPIPPGTDIMRWTTVNVDAQALNVLHINDKNSIMSTFTPETYAWTGLGFIQRGVIRSFWHGIADIFGGNTEGETQIVPGLERIRESLTPRFINWTDVGDEMAYRHAVQRFTGYDFVKVDQATYVLPSEGRVVKFNADPEAITHRVHRATALANTVPKAIRGSRTDTLMAHSYVPGVTAYSAIERDGVEVTKRMLEWFRTAIYSSRNGAPTSDAYDARRSLHAFYQIKTMNRISQLVGQAELHRAGVDSYDQALQAAGSVDYEWLIEGAVWGVPHGDFNYGNVIVTPGGEFVGIDWRENFAGSFFGDLRYDLGKMLAGTYVHWDRAQHGDLRPWDAGAEHAELILDFAWELGINRDAIRVIAGLSLLNSAPLHAEPLSGVLVARGAGILTSFTLDEVNGGD